MDKEKRERLEAKGWSVGTVADFLNLTAEEVALLQERARRGDAAKFRGALAKVADVPPVAEDER